jgi:hypothetical protein
MSDERPRLDDILGANAIDFNDLWDQTEVADEFKPLPAGQYRALVADGKLAVSKAKKTPSYKLVFEVLEPAAFAGRKVYLDLFLTPKALPASKRDLLKLKICSPQQLQQAPPAGIIADIKVALETRDDDKDGASQFNKVVSFQVTGQGTPPGLLEPDADELGESNGEGDTRDADGFDWRKGDQR